MNIINAIILIFTLGITIIPFTGKLWLNEKNKIRILWRGIIFIVFCFFSLLFGVFQVSKESKIQSERDKYQKHTLSNTEKIIDSLEISMNSIEEKLIRIDSLNSKLDSLETKTIASIENRDKILLDFNKLNNQLKKIYIQQDMNIKENSPLVDIFGGVKWIKEKETYKIVIELSNEGERAAIDVNISTWFFIANNSGEIINHKVLSTELISGDNLPPRNKSHKRMQYKFPNFPRATPNDSLSKGYILVNYGYKDFVTDIVFYKTKGFIWRGVKLDGLEWISMPVSISQKLDDYLLENNIVIKKST